MLIIKDLARIQSIIQKRLEGWSYQAIGDELHVSRQRIQQLVRPPREVILRLKLRSGGTCESCGIRLYSNAHVHHIENGDLDFNDFDNLRYLCPSCHRQSHKKPAQQYTCQVCGKLSVNESFCGWACHKAYTAAKNTVNCLTCGKPVVKSAAEIRRHTLHFCSRTCLGSYMGKHYGFSAHPELGVYHPTNFTDGKYSAKEAGILCGVKANTITVWCHSGKLQAVKSKRQWRVPKSEVRRLIKKSCQNCVYFVPGYGIYQMQDAYCSKHPTKSAPCSDWHNESL